MDRTGAETVATRWACVLGVPIVPLGEHDPEITCDECGHSSDLGVLDVPTTAQLSRLLREASVAALVLAVRTSECSLRSSARAAAVTALDEAGFTATLATFDDALDNLNDIEAHLRLRRIGHELTAFGKQGFLHRVAAVCSASGTDAARDTLVQIGCDLGMAAPHINGVLAVADITV